MNAELEAKTANLVAEAEEVLVMFHRNPISIYLMHHKIC